MKKERAEVKDEFGLEKELDLSIQARSLHKTVEEVLREISPNRFKPSRSISR